MEVRLLTGSAIAQDGNGWINHSQIELGVGNRSLTVLCVSDVAWNIELGYMFVAKHIESGHSNPTRYTDGPSVKTMAPPAMNSCPGAVSSRKVVWPVLLDQE